MKKSLFLLFVGLIMLSPVRVFAIIAEGTSGTCKWAIDDNGQLVVSPINGVEGELGSDGMAKLYSGDSWHVINDLRRLSQKQSVTSVVFKGIITSKSCAFMFDGYSNLKSIEWGNFKTDNTEDMCRMFFECYSLVSLDVSKFNTANVTSMYSMFDGCHSLTSLDVCKFNTANVTDMCGMFDGCSSLTSLDLSSFNTNNVTRMDYMFRGCHSLTSLDVCKFNTANVTDMDYMFKGCSSLTSLDVSKFNTGNVTRMYGMFEDCSSLTSLDVSKFNTGNVTRMENMFYGCSSLTSLDVSKFNTGNVTRMDNMFYGCHSLASLDVSKFNTDNVTSMSCMFKGCSSLTSLDVSKFNTANVTDMSSMFCYCGSLSSLDLTNFTVLQSCDAKYAFGGVKAQIISNSKTPSAMPDTFFDSYEPVKSYCLTVPAGSENEYYKASGWRRIMTWVLTDDNTVIPQMPYKKYLLLYERKVSGKYATFCLPFDLVPSSWLEDTGYINEVYKITSIGKRDESTGLIKVNVTKDSYRIKAGTPFIVKLANGQDKITLVSNYAKCDFTDGYPTPEEVAVNVGADVDVVFSGTLFDKLTGLDKTKYRAFNTDGNFGPSDWVKPFRAYVYKNDKSAKAKADNIILEFEDGTTTAIDAIDGMEVDNDDAPVFNVVGQRVNAQVKGLIIKNGKKVMVK